MFKAAKLSQDLSVTKSCFECSIWILSVMCTASNNRKKKAVNLILMQVCFLLYEHKCFVTNGRNSHFFRLMHSTKLWRVHTPFTSKFRGSTPQTDFKGVKFGASASKTCKLSVIGSPAF